MFNVQCSSVGKDKGAAQISNIGWQTLCRSRQTWDLLPPATKVEDTKWWWWYKFVHLFICCIFFHIIVVNTTFSGWMYICFTVQHTCKCISLFMWHATIVLQSASLITSAIQLQNLAVTSTSKSWTNLETLSSKSEQKLNFMTKVNLPNLHQTVVDMFPIIHFNNSNNFNKFWVAIFTRQGHINQVY